MSTSPRTAPTVALTGARGYVGRRCAEHFRSAGWRVLELVRDSGELSDSVDFRLGESTQPETLCGVQALVHCAYDFGLTRKEDIERVNVQGSIELLKAAHAAGVQKLIFLSSISAYPGCKSLYGNAKLAVEAYALQLRAFVIRPGLIFDDPPGGTFARLLEQVRGSWFVPLIGSGWQIQYLVHNDDLAAFIVQCCAPHRSTPNEIITIAHPQPWPLRALLNRLAERVNRRPFFVPIPWRCVWALLKVAEAFGLSLPFRSDSVISLVHQDPSPDFSVAQRLGVECRPFS